jgi:hypothetical protein
VRGEEGERAEAPEEEERDRDGEGWSSPMGGGGLGFAGGWWSYWVRRGGAGRPGNSRNPASLGRSVPSVPGQLHYRDTVPNRPMQSLPHFLNKLLTKKKRARFAANLLASLQISILGNFVLCPFSNVELYG